MARRWLKARRVETSTKLDHNHFGPGGLRIIELIIRRTSHCIDSVNPLTPRIQSWRVRLKAQRKRVARLRREGARQGGSRGALLTRPCWGGEERGADVRRGATANLARRGPGGRAGEGRAEKGEAGIERDGVKPISQKDPLQRAHASREPEAQE